MSDLQLAQIVIAKIAAVEAQGVRLVEGWGDRPISLWELHWLLTDALAQLEAMS